MNDPIFVKVRNDQGVLYDSYRDYWHLIELSTFPTCELSDVVPDSDQTYIFSPDNGNVAACCERPHRAKYILWQLEIPGQVNLKIPDYFDVMWVSCRYWQSLVPEAAFVVIGGHPDLFKEPQEPKRWDFCHLAYLYGKRAAQVYDLEQQGFTMAPIGWGDIRDQAMAYSQWGLCLHQNPVPALSPQRMTLFACNKLPIVLEEANPEPYEVVKLLDFNRDIDFTQMVENNFKYFTQTMTFRKAVEGAL